MELFARKVDVNGKRKTYLSLSGRLKFLKHLNEICRPSIRPSLSEHIYIFFLLGTMMSLIKPL